MTINYDEWLKNPIKIFCKCGCGQEIIIKKHHKWRGIPEYITGHYRKGKHHSEESKKKISKSHSGKKSYLYGKHLSEETKKKMSESKSGENHPLFGKHHSEESKRKMSESKSGEKAPWYGKHRSEETKKKISENHADFSGEKSYFWQGGISFEPYCPKFNREKKEEVRNQYDRKCYICGKEEKDNITKTNKIRKLSVHHIDRDKEQGCNGKSWKLVPLCLFCHMKEHRNKLEILNNVK